MARHRSKEEVELNMASMLDMAFQLLTFFILTFKPSPVEGQISLHMPPPQAVIGVQGGLKAGDNENADPSTVQPVKTLTITLLSRNGEIEMIQVGVPSEKMEDIDFPRLGDKLAEYFRGNYGFEQVLIQASPSLYYAKLLQVVEVCSKVQMENGEKIGKLSFVALPSG